MYFDEVVRDCENEFQEAERLSTANHKRLRIDLAVLVDIDVKRRCHFARAGFPRPCFGGARSSTEGGEINHSSGGVSGSMIVHPLQTLGRG
ncbi:hypothetical protein PPGU16_17760 [Paraburkholderia largidicola]|uniref:Uncharacterized protein n=1 Tax=Paraburkholderia largidicola TaxID=3014751 RepID=A0A7I8BK80_9BURK|nr:hypothetical protein PPGU16_17760 [Paraburkholderia sp. PGU16]